MQELIMQIESLHKEMEELTLKAGVGKEMYNTIIEAGPELTKEILKDRLDFLNSVKNLFERVRYLWNLNPPSVWDNYKLFRLGFLAEQVQLRKANTELRRAWRKKYGKVESNKEADSQNPFGESIHTNV